MDDGRWMTDDGRRMTDDDRSLVVRWCLVFGVRCLVLAFVSGWWLVVFGVWCCYWLNGLVSWFRLVSFGLAWLGLAWLGLAWLGLAWLGLAWLGLAWLVVLSFGWASSGLVWCCGSVSFGVVGCVVLLCCLFDSEVVGFSFGCLVWLNWCSLLICGCFSDLRCERWKRV